MTPRSAIKTDLFADAQHRKKIDALGDPLAEIESYIDFAALAAEGIGKPTGGQHAGLPAAVYDRDDGAHSGLEAAGLSPEGRNRGLLTPEMGRIAAARGDSRQNRDKMAGDGDDVPQILNRIRPGSLLYGVVKTAGYSTCPELILIDFGGSYANKLACGLTSQWDAHWLCLAIGGHESRRG